MLWAQQILDDFAVFGFAALVLAVADDVDDAAAAAGLAGQLLGGIEDGIVQRMRFLLAGRGCRWRCRAAWSRVGSAGWPFTVGPAVKGPSVRGTPMRLAGLFGDFESGGEARSAGGGEAGDQLRRGAGIADDGDGVGRGQSIGDDGEALVDLLHDVGRQRGVNDQGDGERVGIVAEEDDVLADAVLIRHGSATRAGPATRVPCLSRTVTGTSTTVR